MQNHFSFKKIPKFRQILSSTILFFQTFFYKLFLTALVFFIPFTLIEFFVWNNESLIHQLSARTSNAMVDVFSVFLILMEVIFFYVYLFALIFTVDALDQDQQSSTSKVYVKSLKKLVVGLQLNAIYLFRVFMWSFAFILPGVSKVCAYSLSNFILLLDEGSVKESFQVSEEKIKTQQWVCVIQFCFLSIIIWAFTATIINFFDTGIVIAKNMKLEWLSILFDISEALLICMMGIVPIIFYYQYYKFFVKQIDLGESRYGKCN